jgi:hypothetical protein
MSAVGRKRTSGLHRAIYVEPVGARAAETQSPKPNMTLQRVTLNLTSFTREAARAECLQMARKQDIAANFPYGGKDFPGAFHLWPACATAVSRSSGNAVDGGS